MWGVRAPRTGIMRGTLWQQSEGVESKECWHKAVPWKKNTGMN